MSGSWLFGLLVALAVGGAFLVWRSRRAGDAARLRLRLEDLEAALDAAETGTFHADLKRHRLRWSRYHERIFGYAEGTFDGSVEGFRSRLHGEDKGRVLKVLAEARASGQPYQFESRVVWPDGTIRWILARGRCRHDAAGQPDRVFGTVIDITENKAREHELRLAKVAAEAANRTTSLFLETISHEIRTPLATLVGYADLAIMTNSLPGASQQLLADLSRCGQNLATRLSELIDITHLGAGFPRLRIRRVELDALLDMVTVPLMVAAKARGLRFSLVKDHDLPTTLATDPERLGQVMATLLHNAIRFSSTGEVGVRVRRLGAHVAGKARLIGFTVFDTGPGIGEEKIATLFDPQPVGAEVRRGGHPPRLGLCLARQLARSLGGDLRLDRNQIGRGCEFLFSIDPELPDEDSHAKIAWVAPDSGKLAIATNGKGSDATRAARYQPAGSRAGASDARDGSLPSDANSEATCLKSIRILLAEDAPDISFIMSRFLEGAGASVEQVADGEVVVERALAGDYDIILMDLGLPGQDGLSATKCLRDAGFTRPIVAVTAHAYAEEIERARSAGCSAHIAKPVNRQQLIADIASLVGRPWSSPPASRLS